MGNEDDSALVGDLLERLVARADRIRSFVSDKTPPKLRSHISPDDILQEVSMAAFRKVSSFTYHSESSFDRWLTTITKNKLADALLAARTRHRLGQQADVRAFKKRSASFLDLLDHAASPQLTPSRENATKEAVGAIRIVLSSLPDDRRQAITMHYIDGKPAAEIANAMQKTAKAVEGLLYHGLRQMRKRLGHEGKYFSDARSSSRVVAQNTKVR